MQHVEDEFVELFNITRTEGGTGGLDDGWFPTIHTYVTHIFAVGGDGVGFMTHQAINGCDELSFG